MKFGLALGGGGVRGAFQIGVWKALRKMDIELCSVVGTSVGAVNGALIVQGDYDQAVKLWCGINAADIVNLPQGADDGKNLFSAANITELASLLRKNGGLDMTPFAELLRSVIDENALRRSKIDFGAVSFSLTRKKGVYKFKDEIPNGSLTDYIIASASILSTKDIDGETFSDGGIYDNIPVNMLLQQGIDDIITVDVKGVGRSRSFSSAGKNIVTIRSREPQTGLMEFDRAGIMRGIDDGYIEALRAFGDVMGENYAFDTAGYLNARKSLSCETISGLEKAAEHFGVNRLEIYTVDGLRSIVTDCFYKLSQKNPKDSFVKAVNSAKKGAESDIAASALAYFTD